MYLFLYMVLLFLHISNSYSCNTNQLYSLKSLLIVVFAIFVTIEVDNNKTVCLLGCNINFLISWLFR